jgi:uncharacterized membrane protein (Fun14 family)
LLHCGWWWQVALVVVVVGIIVLGVCHLKHRGVRESCDKGSEKDDREEQEKK